MKFYARVTSVGESGKKNKKNIFHVFSQALPYTNWHKFWVTCSSRGRNQLCKVLSWSVKRFGFCEGSKFYHSHWIAMSPLTLLGTNFLAMILVLLLLNFAENVYAQ